MKTVRLLAGRWFTEASQVSTFFERFRGMRGASADARYLFEASSVHTLGMTRSISVVMIDHDLRVIRAHSLLPNRVVYERRARFILELPSHAALPEVGASVEIVDG
jgi:hypothetical protein